ncbi:MAG: HAD family hydrolase [Cellvibrionaceae bacterium]|nr:HAD family hydrolase [Cellvibrionaceae bacterium]
MRIECFEPYDAVFFDLDGTLYDDQQYDRGAYALIAEHFPDESDLQTQLLELKRRRGRLDGNLFDDYCRERGLTGEAAVRMVQIYRDFVPQTLPMDSQMEKLLQLLESRKLFLVTNGRTVTQTKK